MLRFFLLSHQKDRHFLQKQILLENAELACLGNNTEYHKLFQRCVCKKGFPYGNPEKEGCYACNNVTCHPDGYCAAMNTCKCKQGRVGDGITTCDFPRPKITSLDPTVCNTNENSFITFSFTAPTGYNISRPDCMFGPRVVTPTEFNGTHGICKCPPSHEGKFKFALSFDRIHWSLENYTISFVNDGYNAESIFEGIEMFIISCALVFICAWFIPKVIRRTTDDGDQILPLNKWHMSQNAHDPTNEQNFFKFLLGLLI